MHTHTHTEQAAALCAFIDVPRTLLVQISVADRVVLSRITNRRIDPGEQLPMRVSAHLYDVRTLLHAAAIACVICGCASGRMRLPCHVCESASLSLSFSLSWSQ
jgi:hypothetical protein